MSLRFLDEAAVELVAAIRYYADEDPELAIDFDRAVEERLEMAAKVPGAGRLEPRAQERFELRWCRDPPFPVRPSHRFAAR